MTLHYSIILKRLALFASVSTPAASGAAPRDQTRFHLLGFEKIPDLRLSLSQ